MTQHTEHEKYLLQSCHELLDELAKTPYKSSMLRKVQDFLLTALQYKGNRNNRTVN
ncbi:MAG: hypothetical protein AAFR37_00460 [Cyanobacteria bacterium J06628_3]